MFVDDKTIKLNELNSATESPEKERYKITS